MAADDLPLWLVNTKLSGDFRYRHEGITKEGSSALYRNRIRYRIGIETIVNDKVTVGGRLASGTGDVRSTNQDLGDGLSAKPINLDRAYFQIVPQENFWFSAGKIANPFVCTDLQWDGDVNFEGGVGAYTTGKSTQLLVRGGAFWLEPYRSQHGGGIWVGQVEVTGEHAGGAWQAAAGMYSYANRNLLAENGGFGNTILPDGQFKSDFEIFDVVLSTMIKLPRSKLVVTLNPIMNTATSEEKIGWLASLKLKGKILKRSCSLSYDYRVLEADAVFGAFTDSDASGGRTDQRGHRFLADIELIDGFTVAGSAFFYTLSASGDGSWYQRWMLDGSVKF